MSSKKIVHFCNSDSSYPFSFKGYCPHIKYMSDSEIFLNRFHMPCVRACPVLVYLIICVTSPWDFHLLTELECCLFSSVFGINTQQMFLIVNIYTNLWIYIKLILLFIICISLCVTYIIGKLFYVLIINRNKKNDWLYSPLFTWFCVKL